MKTWLRRIAFCGLLGLLTACLVAWGLALVSIGPPLQPVAVGTLGRSPPTWQVHEERRIGFRSTQLLALSKRWVYQSTSQLVKVEDTELHMIPLAAAPPAAGVAGGQLFRRDAAGFPLPALYCESTGEQDSKTGRFTYSAIRGGIALDRAGSAAGSRDRTLPYLPVWRGLLLDGGLYALLWLGAWTALAAMIRQRRRGAGSCPRCGYDLRGDLSAGCPECGWKRGGGAAAGR